MQSSVPVWDPFVRIFHWSVAVAFIACRFATEGGDPPHEWLGYGAAALVALRVGWGFVGRGAARWSDFWPTASRLATQLRELRAGRPHRHHGHMKVVCEPARVAASPAIQTVTIALPAPPPPAPPKN